MLQESWAININLWHMFKNIQQDDELQLIELPVSIDGDSPPPPLLFFFSNALENDSPNSHWFTHNFVMSAQMNWTYGHGDTFPFPFEWSKEYYMVIFKYVQS